MKVQHHMAYAMQNINNVQGATGESKKVRVEALQALKDHIDRAQRLVVSEPEEVLDTPHHPV